MRIAMIALLLCLPLSAFAVDFFEDFESYYISDDPDISPDWDRDDDGGQVLVADDAGNKVAQSNFDGNTYIGYTCDAAELMVDTKVDFDFKYDGQECGCGLSARIQGGTEEAYIGYIYILNVNGDSIVSIQYVENNFTLTELYAGPGPQLDLFTWYNLKFVATGNDPVNLKLYIDGSLYADYDDDTYLLGDGWAGFGCAYDGSAEPVYSFDNFFADDTPFPVESTSLGGIKAIYR